MTVEVVRSLSHQGFGYACRTLRNPAPRTEPVLLLGGLLMDMHGWSNVEPYLAPVTTVVTVDPPGSGQADRLPPSYGFDFLGAVLEDMLATLNLPRVNVVGYSYGVMLAYTLAQRYPERVARLMLVGGWEAGHTLAGREAAGMARSASLLAQGRLTDFTGHTMGLVMAGDDRRAVRQREGTARVVEHLLRSDRHTRHYQENVQRMLTQPLYQPGDIRGIPALVVTGEHDSVTPPADGRRLAEAIDGARFAAIREADHLVLIERTAELADLIVRFVTDRSLDGLPYL